MVQEKGNEMAIINGTYYACYEDYEGGDEVPCKVDDEKMEVVSFGKATKCRWYEDVDVMCTEEWVKLDDGRDFEAIKFDEYNDAVLDGFDDDYERENIVLFDADKLAESMGDFEDSALAEAMRDLRFITCDAKGVPGIPTNTSTVSEDVHDAVEHMKRAIATMEKNNERVAGYNEKWPNFYDDYLEKAAEMLERIKEAAKALDGLESDVRMMG